MRYALASALAAFLFLAGRQSAFADCSIGGNQVTTDTQAEYLSATFRVTGVAVTERAALDDVQCGGDLQSEVWIDGYSGAQVMRDPSTYARAFISHVSTFSGLHTVRSKHWFINTNNWPISESWHLIINGIANTFVFDPPECQPPSGGCPIEGSVWDPVACECTQGCPLIIDRNDDGILLTSLDEGVAFDINGDGSLERVAWTRADSDDAWLVLDRNGNGRIDSGRELFGNATPAYADSPMPTTFNGFDALRFAEGPLYGASNGDALIDARDAVFGRLMLWTDRNHNGFSEPDELTPVRETDLAAIETRYRVSRRRDEFGNQFKLKGQAYWLTERGRLRARPVFDVFLLTGQ